MSQQVNKHSPATVSILQGHKRLLGFSAKPVKEGSSGPLRSSLLWKISDTHKRRENCIKYPPWTHHLALINTDSRPVMFYLWPGSSPLPDNFEANSRWHAVSSVNISVTAPSYSFKIHLSKEWDVRLPTSRTLRRFGQYMPLCLGAIPWVWQVQGLPESSPKSDLILGEKEACIKCHTVVPPWASFLVSAGLLSDNWNETQTEWQKSVMNLNLAFFTCVISFRLHQFLVYHQIRKLRPKVTQLAGICGRDCGFMLSFSVMSDSVTLWIVAFQAPGRIWLDVNQTQFIFFMGTATVHFPGSLAIRFGFCD